MKNEKFHTIRAVPISNLKFVETEIKCIPRTHICMIVHFPLVLGTGTSIKSVRINLGSYSHPIVVNWRGYVSVSK